jgi:hypothetical protein
MIHLELTREEEQYLPEEITKRLAEPEHEEGRHRAGQTQGRDAPDFGSCRGCHCSCHIGFRT